LYEFDESTEVDDYVEMKNVINQYRSIDPKMIEEEFIPRLE
jgi:hypothetical protein